MLQIPIQTFLLNLEHKNLK